MYLSRSLDEASDIPKIIANVFRIMESAKLRDAWVQKKIRGSN